MSGVNKVILIGNLGNDPEIKATQSGSQLANFSVATSETWKDKNTGERQEKTEWHKVVMFGRQAEVAGQYLQKGSKVFIEGKLSTRKWEDKSGNTRYTTEIVGSYMQMLGEKSQQPPQTDGRPVIANFDNAAPSARDAGVEMDFDDDIPF